MSALKPALNHLSNQLSNRVRMGFVVLLALTALAGLIELDTRNTALRQELIAVRTELTSHHAMLRQQDWFEITTYATDTLEQVESQFWTAATTGLASAEILGVVEAAARDAALGNPQVTVLESAVLSNGAVLFEVELTARDDRGQFATFMETLARAEGEIRPFELNWQGQGRPVSILLLAPAMIEEVTAT